MPGGLVVYRVLVRDDLRGFPNGREMFYIEDSVVAIGDFLNAW